MQTPPGPSPPTPPPSTPPPPGICTDAPDETCLGKQQEGWKEATCTYATSYCADSTWGAEARRCCPKTCRVCDAKPPPTPPTPPPGAAATQAPPIMIPWNPSENIATCTEVQITDPPATAGKGPIRFTLKDAKVPGYLSTQTYPNTATQQKMKMSLFRLEVQNADANVMGFVNQGAGSTNTARTTTRWFLAWAGADESRAFTEATLKGTGLGVFAASDDTGNKIDVTKATWTEATRVECQSGSGRSVDASAQARTTGGPQGPPPAPPTPPTPGGAATTVAAWYARARWRAAARLLRRPAARCAQPYARAHDRALTQALCRHVPRAPRLQDGRPGHAQVDSHHAGAHLHGLLKRAGRLRANT